MLNRRCFLGAAALALTACAAPRPAPANAPVDTVDGLIDRIAAAPGLASVVVDDGRSPAFALDADRLRPLASANKALTLVAYAQAVAAGRIDPNARVTVADWERWYVPGTDGQAHVRAVQALGVGPGDTVSWDDLARVMIDFSDAAAPDLIRATLGDAALTAAAAAVGWTDPQLPSHGGEGLLAPVGLLPDPPPVTAADRSALTWSTLRGYAADPALRAEVARRAAPLIAATTASTPAPADPAATGELDAILRWYAGSPGGSAHQVAGLYRAVATGALGPAVTAVARRHLERTLATKLPPGVLGAAQKGGNYPGIYTNGFSVRRDDGTVGVAVVLLSGLDIETYGQVLSSASPLLLSQQVLLDPAVRDRLRAAVGAA